MHLSLSSNCPKCNTKHLIQITSKINLPSYPTLISSVFPMIGSAVGPGILLIKCSKRLRRTLNNTKYAHNTVNNIMVNGEKYVSNDKARESSTLFIFGGFSFSNFPLKHKNTKQSLLGTHNSESKMHK